MNLKNEMLKEGVFGSIQPFPKAGELADFYAIKDIR
jgi:hypothetical protein